MVNYSPIHMIQWSGYKPNWRKGKKDNIYDKFLKCMEWSFTHEYLFNFDKKAYFQNNLQSSMLNNDKLIPKDNFGIIYDFEIEAIMNYESNYKPLNKSVLLLLLAYIRAFTWVRKNEFTGHSEKSKKEKPEIFHSQFDTIEQFIGVNRKMVAKATDILVQLGIMRTHRMPNYQDKNGYWHTDDIIYICPYKFLWDNHAKYFRLCNKEQYDPYKEMGYGMEYLRNCRYQSKKFYQD